MHLSRPGRPVDLPRTWESRRRPTCGLCGWKSRGVSATFPDLTSMAREGRTLLHSERFSVELEGNLGIFDAEHGMVCIGASGWRDIDGKEARARGRVWQTTGSPMRSKLV